MNVPKLKKNYLLAKVLSLLNEEKRGRILDLGCGSGMYSKEFHALGFDVTAADVNSKNFSHEKTVRFQPCNLAEKLPFEDSSFDYVTLIETLEHLEKPFDVIGELSRILKPDGQLIVSTPNILNLRSRLRFFSEGCFDFFREPPIELQTQFVGTIENIHIIPWRYHELEYLLFRQGFHVKDVHTDYMDHRSKLIYILFYPFLQLQRKIKEQRSHRKGGLDFRRINEILFMDEIMFGKHLILKATNVKKKGQSFGYYKRENVQLFDPAKVKSS